MKQLYLSSASPTAASQGSDVKRKQAALQESSATQTRTPLHHVLKGAHSRALSSLMATSKVEEEAGNKSQPFSVQKGSLPSCEGCRFPSQPGISSIKRQFRKETLPRNVLRLHLEWQFGGASWVSLAISQAIWELLEGWVHSYGSARVFCRCGI